MRTEDWSLVKSVFERALEQPSEARETWLRDQKDITEGVRDQVQELLRGADKSTSFSSVFQAEALEPEAPRQQFLPGDLIGDRFEVRGLLGKGGMGEVYCAWDHTSETLVALKAISNDFVNRPELRRQLLHELRNARKVQSPYICKMYDVHEASTPSGSAVVFLTMELLKGETLSERLERTPLNEHERRLLAEQIALALEAIHRERVVHRDLKTSNLFVIDGPAFHVKVLDFGLSREIESAQASGQTSMFGLSAMVGTISYMAPEIGEAKPATSRSDIYSYGVILYRAFTGRLPFEGPPLTVMSKKCWSDPPSPREFVPEIPEFWERLILRCIQRDPSERPQSASEVLAMLRGEIEPEPIVAPIDESTDANATSSKPSRRTWLTTAGATLGAGALGAAWWRWRQPGEVNPAAVRAFKRGEELVRRRTRESMRTAIEEYQSALRIEPNYAEAWAGLADAYASAAHFVFEDSKKARAEAEKAALKALSLRDDLPRAHGALAFVRGTDIRRWKQSGALFEKALRSYPKEPLLHNWYAAYLGRAGRHQEAIEHARTALELEPGSYGNGLQLTVELFRAMKLDEHLEQARELVRLHSLEATAHQALGRALEWTRQFDEAEQELKQADVLKSDERSMAYWSTLRAAQGKLEEARMLAGRLRKAWENGPMEANSVVGVYASLNDPETVAMILVKAIQAEDGSVLAAPTNPYVRNVRNHPRVRPILQQLS
jgi:serine/threonine protein kinase/tetratricopeptide (TPR) repeat protein